MTKLRLGRFTTVMLCIALFALGLALAPAHSSWRTVAIVFGLLSLLGVWDLIQSQHSVLRNYPVIGHVRWLVEMIRPEIRQYLLEGDEEAAPFSRDQRSLAYRRAKGLSSDHPFGTQLDVYARDYEFASPSATINAPSPTAPASSTSRR